MKNTFLSSFAILLFTITFSFTSCEKDEHEVNPDQNSNQTEITPDTKITGKAGGFTNEKVYRYYQGGSSSLHTYRTQSGTGSAIGRREGIAFTIPTSASSSGVDRNKYNFLWFLLHPQQKDFILTTSSSEFWNLRRQGWKNVTYKYILIQKGSGNGAKKLYRFYDTKNSDHLFTKNYTEGVNAGLKYEGTVGWVF